MSELDIKYNEIEDLDYCLELLKKRDEEIERLNNKVEELMTLYTTERNVKEDYKIIIKEVREYIENMKTWDIEQEYDIKKILEILDKTNDRGDNKK